MKQQLFLALVVLAATQMYGTQAAYSGTDLINAISAKDMEKLSMILNDASTNVNDKGSNGWTPLLTASRQMHEESVQRLLRARALTFFCEADGWTALHFSAALGNAPITRMLLDAGADALHKNKFGQTPLSLAEGGDNAAVKELFKAAMEKRGAEYGRGEQMLREFNERAAAEAAGHLPPGVQRAPDQQQQQQVQAQAQAQQQQRQEQEQERQRQLQQQQEQELQRKQREAQQRKQQEEEAARAAAAAERAKQQGSPTTPQAAAGASGNANQGGPMQFDYGHMYELAGRGDLETFKRILSEHAHSRTTPPSPAFNWAQRSPKGLSVLMFAAAGGAPHQQQYDFAKYVLDLRAAGERSIDVDAAEGDGWTALMFAVFQGNDKLVSLLLDAGANAQIRNKKGMTAYDIAAQTGKKDIARRVGSRAVVQLLQYALTESGRSDARLPQMLNSVIITSGCDANTVIPPPDHNGITALMLVAIHDDTGQLAETLVTKGGADMYARDVHGWSVSMYAIAAQRLKVLQTFIRLVGGDAHKLFALQGTADAETAMSVAMDTGNQDIINLVKTHSTAGAAKPPAAGKRTGHGSAYHGKRIRTSDWDDKKGSPSGNFAPPVTVVPGKYASDINDAIAKNNLAGLRYFINDGGDLHFISNGGFDAMHSACSKGHADIVKLLLEHGASPNNAENDGWTPLMFASHIGRVDIVDLLLDAGANPLAVNKHGRAAFDLAINNGHKQVGARVASEAILKAIRLDDGVLIQTLLRAGANPSSFDSETGRTPLMALVRNPAVPADVIDSFLNDFSYVDLNTMDKDGNTALFHAIQRGDVPIVSTLIAHGADTSRRNRAGLTPLEMAKLRISGPSIAEVINVVERFPTAESMQRALAALRNIQTNKHARLSLKDAAHALSEPSIDPSLLAGGSGNIGINSAGMGIASKSATKPKPPASPQDEADELRKKNAELSRNLEQIATKARQEYSTKAKERAIAERQHKERIVEAERKKKEESGKGFFAKLFGW